MADQDRTKGKKAPKLVGPFPRGTRPWRRGAYKTMPKPNSNMVGFQYWNGAYWGLIRSTPYLAKKNGRTRSSHQKPKWWGIATMEQQYRVPIDEPGLNTEGDTGAEKPDAVLA
ncbi:hypothetical protein KMC49_gp36 [Ralstonia phage Firinga]|uniref:Uncharacterized protein n=1 Tax=Ralstonia phage Firinga TaxID=2759725 RepID=A0A7G5B9Y1_9CAUD|nr:hypothetical protein KMC49_gp36 [Ralstonia phage Firinga]QMV33104.1 hypothetical protein 18C_00036 [Ralstonia phage Firinga]